MEIIGVSSGRPPSVNRTEGSTAVFLTFDGPGEAKVRNRDTRVRIALKGPQAVRCRRSNNSTRYELKCSGNSPTWMFS
jgi:hypothetical protein